MILISHRGNIDGKMPELENEPIYILDALDRGYNVEVDVWYDNGYWLGHDAPVYPIGVTFLKNKKLWCHAKNSEALFRMQQESNIHWFWHQDDDYSLTSAGYIWTFPKKLLYYNSVCVLPEQGYTGDLNDCYGICSDFIKKY